MLFLISGRATCPRCVRVVNFNTELDGDTLETATRKFRSSHRYCGICSKFGMKIEVDFVVSVVEWPSAGARKVPFTVSGFDPISGERVLCVEVASEIARPTVDDTVTDNNDQHWLVLGVHKASTPLDWRVDVRRVPASYKWR
jgi:hypothetical protein